MASPVSRAALEHKGYQVQNLGWEGDLEALVGFSGYHPLGATVQGGPMTGDAQEERGRTKGHLTLDSKEKEFSCPRTRGRACCVESTTQEGVIEESPRHVWGMVRHPCDWNPRLAVEELMKIKTGRRVESSCK